MDAICTALNAQRHWQAELRLGLAARAGRTVLSERWHRGPLRVQRPFYPEGDKVCHVYLLHPPGGVVPGDQLNIKVHAQPGAHGVLTTPAATKLYACDDRSARLQQQLEVSANAVLEWLPQETIVYSGAQVDLVTQVQLQDHAVFIGWEMLCLGRPASAQPFTQGRLRQRFEIWRDAKPLWIERARFVGGAEALSADWGLAGASCCASLVCVGGDAQLTASIRDAVNCAEGESFAVTQLPEVTVCRYLGPHAALARKRLTRAWHCMRSQLLTRAACEPRIWQT